MAVKMTFNNNSIMRGLPMYAQFGTKGLRKHGKIRQGRRRGHEKERMQEDIANSPPA